MFWRLKITKSTKFEAPKKAKTVVLGLLNYPKLITNKIRNLGLIFEENENKINVFAGPFEKNDINLKIDFLIRNGYSNAQLYP